MRSVCCLLQLKEPRIRIRNFLTRLKPSMFTDHLRARSMQELHTLPSLLDLAYGLDPKKLKS
jgi:hypothetical protein